jgi:D-sedoheptulose 7-phosphate isomerase
MVGRYKGDRPAYPVVALTADGAVITCIGNDYGYDEIFKRQVTALGKEGDIFIGLTTSGTSKNILLAAKQARKQGMTIIAFTGEKGKFKDMADNAIISPSKVTARIQELHLHAIHLICETFEK